MFHRLVPNVALALGALALVALAGCGRQSDSNQPEQPSAQTRQVTVDVTGLS